MQHLSGRGFGGPSLHEQGLGFRSIEAEIRYDEKQKAKKKAKKKADDLSTLRELAPIELVHCSDVLLITWGKQEGLI